MPLDESSQEPQPFHLKISLAEEQNFYQDHAKGSDASALGTVYDFPTKFGLKEGDWAAFDHKIKQLSKPGEVEYVLVYLARHGQGYHNIGEEYVGTPSWRRSSALSQKPVHEYFFDARLTPVGQHQANTLSSTLEPMLSTDAQQSMPWPQKFYTSPLHRACETSYRTWSPLANPAINRVYNPIVEESLREQMYLEKCNKRSTRTEMLESFTFNNALREQKGLQPVPMASVFHIPEDLPETDVLFETLASRHEAQTQAQAQTQTQTQSKPQSECEQESRASTPMPETEAEATIRAHAALHKIMSSNFGTNTHYISLTTHAGLMSAIYQIFAIPHVDVPRFPTGIIVPLLLRVEKVSHPVTVNDVAAHISNGVKGCLSLDEQRSNEGGLEKILADIEDQRRYSRAIELREEMVARGEKVTKELLEEMEQRGTIDKLDRLVLRAFFLSVWDSWNSASNVAVPPVAQGLMYPGDF